MQFQIQNKSQFVTEFRQGGWLVLVIFLGLAASRVVVEHFWGRGWAAVAATAAAAAWFIFRPSRLGLISNTGRRDMFWGGAIPLCAWALLAALAYWR
ncbi:MAG: hypothetical protein ABSE48_07245 [Verrucomicrobiota bacterium]